jgi:hypothetical protein
VVDYRIELCLGGGGGLECFMQPEQNRL